jgi:hypothetical protein
VLFPGTSGNDQPLPDKPLTKEVLNLAVPCCPGVLSAPGELLVLGTLDANDLSP